MSKRESMLSVGNGIEISGDVEAFANFKTTIEIENSKNKLTRLIAEREKIQSNLEGNKNKSTINKLESKLASVDKSIKIIEAHIEKLSKKEESKNPAVKIEVGKKEGKIGKTEEEKIPKKETFVYQAVKTAEEKLEKTEADQEELQEFYFEDRISEINEEVEDIVNKSPEELEELMENLDELFDDLQNAESELEEKINQMTTDGQSLNKRKPYLEKLVKIREYKDEIKKFNRYKGKIKKLIFNEYSSAVTEEEGKKTMPPEQQPRAGEIPPEIEGGAPQFIEKEEYDNPITREKREDDDNQIKRIEKASGITFELDRETVKSLKDEITKEIDLKTEELAKEYLRENDPESQDLEGVFAIQRVKELGKLDEIKDSSQEIENLYALRVDLGGKKENTLVPLESRRLILNVLNSRAERGNEEIETAKKSNDVQEAAKKTKENDDLFVLREKLTEKIIGKSFTQKLLADGEFRGHDDFIEKELNESIDFQRIIIDGLEDYLQANNDSELNPESKGISEFINDFVEKNKEELEECQKFISDNLKGYKKDALEKLGIADNYSIACIKKAGYEIKYHKPFFGKGEISLHSDDETIKLKKIDDLGEIMENIKEKAEKAWALDFHDDADKKWNEKVKMIKEEGMNSLGSESSEGLDNLYGKLKNRLIEDDFYKNIKAKSPEQLAKIKEAFGGKEREVKGFILDATDIMDDFTEEDLTDKNIEVINDFRKEHDMLPISMDKIRDIDKKNSLKFKSAKRTKETWARWLIGLDFPIGRGKGKSGRSRSRY